VCTIQPGIKWLSGALIVWMIALGNGVAWTQTVGSVTQSVTSQEILVRYRSEAAYSDIVSTYRTLGLNELSYSPYNGLRKVRVPAGMSVYTAAASLNQNPAVAFAEPNYLRVLHLIPNDPLYQYQWHLRMPMMELAWEISRGNNVIAAIVDTGVAYRTGGGYAQAPDLEGTAFMPGHDFVNDDPYPDDDNRHGTHIAGTIAQSTNNLLGGAGVAPGCIILPVKVLDEKGYGDVATIVDGIYYAVNNGAQVINMSLGGSRPGKGPRKKSTAEEEAVNYAVSQGVTVICSAGNESTNLPSYPAAYDATICVSATTYDQSFASAYSNYGPDVDVCAPGGDLNEDLNNDEHPDGIYQQTHDGKDYTKFDFYFAEGTSSAAAYVSGVAALIVGCAGRIITPDEIREILYTTAIDLGDPGWDQYFGWGLVNPLAAVQAVTAPAAEGIFLRTPLRVTTPFFGYPQAISSPLVTQNSRVSFQANAGFAPLGQPVTQGQTAQVFPVSLQNTPFQANYALLNPSLSGFGSQYVPFLYPLQALQRVGSTYTQPVTPVSYQRATEAGFIPGQVTFLSPLVNGPSNIFNPSLLMAFLLTL